MMKVLTIVILMFGLVGCSKIVYKDKTMGYNPTCPKDCFETKSNWKFMGSIRTDENGVVTIKMDDDRILDTDFPY